MFPSIRGVSSAWNVIRNQTLLGLPTLEDPLVRKMGKRVFLVARKLKKTFSVTMYTCQNVCHIQYVHRLLPEVSGDFLRKIWIRPASDWTSKSTRSSRGYPPVEFPWDFQMETMRHELIFMLSGHQTCWKHLINGYFMPNFMRNFVLGNSLMVNGDLSHCDL